VVRARSVPFENNISNVENNLLFSLGAARVVFFFFLLFALPELCHSFNPQFLDTKGCLNLSDFTY
jgi:hypothetical protein